MNPSVLDQADDQREGEELDAAVVTDFIRAAVPDVKGTARIKQFSGGASNLTYAISFDNKEYILRRPPFGKKAKSAHDMGREYRVMQKLKPVYPYVPTMVAFCQDESVLGCDFYVMERLIGIIPREDMPRGLVTTPEQNRALCFDVLDRFIELHSVDYAAANLADLGKGDGYVVRQIEGWNKRFLDVKTPDVPDFEKIMAWLHANMPAQVKTCIIHNDYRMDNVVLDPNNPSKVIGVLDWEMATLGDPLMDLGNTLAYWVEANDPPPAQMLRRQPSHLPGMLTRNEVIDNYCGKMNLSTDNFMFYRAYGIFRLAVILQQIYYRFYHGQTKNPAFGAFGMMVNILERQCQDLLAGEL
jgi:aminoglycoside phosphotransferase (APT) family kinase protein